MKLDADSGEFLGYAVDRYSDPPTGTEPTREEALAMISRLLTLPDGAQLERFSHVEWAPNRRLVELEWKHMHAGLRVDGDWIRVVAT